MGDRRVDLLAAKDSEIRRSMGAVPVGAGSSQVATSGRVIVASAVGRRFCRPTVPTWLGPIRGAVWQSAGPLSASCSSSSISSRLNPWDYARLTDETTDTASARYRDSPENDRAGAASRSSARNSAASGR